MRLEVLNNRAGVDRHGGAGVAAGLDTRGLERDLRRVCEGGVRFDSTTRAIYSTDAGNYRQIPIGVTIPRSAEEIVEIMRVCHAHGAPVLPRGAATSLGGQCCNVAVVIDTSKHVNRVLEVDPERRLARVEPGARLDWLRKRIEGPHGLTYAPDPATHQYCTMGGMIGNNSCGVHSMIGGRSADCVEELGVVTADGVRMRVGRTSEQELEEIIAGGGRRGEIYRGLREIRDRYGGLVRDRFPDIPRRVSGYNLDELLPERGFNVARALVGTEGTCAMVLEAMVRLHRWPRHRVLVVLGYDSVYEAGDHVKDILPFGPIGLEGMDEELVAYMKRKGRHVENLRLLPEGGGWLMAEIGADTQKEAEDAAREMMAQLGRRDGAPGMRLLTDEGDIERVWEVRESGLGATAFVPGFDDTWPGWEDTAVHPHDLGDYLRDLRRLLEKHGYGCALYGHFGQACVHCRIDFDLTSAPGIRTYRRFLDEASDLVVRYGGSFSAEHGDGQARGIFLPKLYGPELMEAFRGFKRLWDPEWKMNPGKVIDAAPPDSNLHLGTDYAPRRVRTHFSYTEDQGSFARAAMRCVGVGKCLRTEEGFMCPTYRVTREERHTTRGRARALFEMMRGDFIESGWKSEEVRETLDLCISCKGCKSDCPVNVDMATYKAEFLSHYYKGRVRPRHHFAMGLIDCWAGLAALAPGLANFVGQTPPLCRMAKWAAEMAQERPLPRFAAQTFTRWFRGRARRTGGREVVLVPDTFYDHFHPGALKAAVLVLERLGYSVRLPGHRVPEVRPVIHYGMLRLAKRRLTRAVRALAPDARAGVPIIGIEPSSVSVFRDELTDLLPHDMDARRVRDSFRLLSEFLAEEGVELPRLGGRAVLHNHCHHKAVLNAGATLTVLGKMGIEAEEPEPGCCGLAGSFGFEAEHFDVAMEIGEQRLLPAVRSAGEDALIVTEGFSCRKQIEDATARGALHLSEVLLMALGRGDEGIALQREERDVRRRRARLSGAQFAAGAAAIGGAMLAGIVARRALSRRS